MKQRVKISVETQRKIQVLVQEMNTIKNKAMKSLQEGKFQHASLMFNLDARNSDKLSTILKEEFKKQEEE